MTRVPNSPKPIALKTLGDRPLDELLARGGGGTVNGKYVHWDKLRHLAPPQGLTAQAW